MVVQVVLSGVVVIVYVEVGVLGVLLVLVMRVIMVCCFCCRPHETLLHHLREIKSYAANQTNSGMRE